MNKCIVIIIMVASWIQAKELNSIELYQGFIMGL